MIILKQLGSLLVIVKKKRDTLNIKEVMYWTCTKASDGTDARRTVNQLHFRRLQLTVFRGHIDIEVEAVLALVLDVARRHVQVVGEPHGEHDLWQHTVDVLWAHGRELRGVADLLPGPRGLRRLEAAVTNGRRGVGYAEVLLHRAQDLVVQILLDSSELAIVGGDYGVFGGVYLLA